MMLVGANQKSAIQKVRKPTWFGLQAVVEIGPGFFHKAGLGKVLIPHPPVINWLLRRRLSKDAKETLSLAHEFAHLQTTPLALAYAAGLYIWAFTTGQPGWLEIVVMAISAHFAWEIMAELYTILRHRAAYTRAYRGKSWLPRVLFWSLCTVFMLSGWFIQWR